MKKLLSILLAVCMMCTALPVLAAETDSAAMQAVLADVKGKVSVPEELKRFSSYSNADENDKKQTYRFVWENEKGDQRITVMTGADEKIMYYSFRDDTADYDEKQFNRLTVEEAKTTVDAFLEKIIPEKTVKLRYIRGVNNGTSSYTYEYQHEENGYLVADEGVSVSVHMKDGQAVITNMSIEQWTNDGFTVPEKDIGIEKAKEIYKQNGGYELQYLRNYKDDSLYLVYQAKDGVKYFDAQTGEEVSYREFSLYRNAGDGMSNEIMASAKAEATEDAVAFTPEETAELERIEGVLSEQQVLDKLRGISEISIPDGEVLSKNIQKTYGNDHDNTKYTMSLRIGTEEKWAHVSVDAMTGELLSYYDNYKIAEYSDEKKCTDAERKTAKDMIDNFVKTYAPSYAGQVRYQSDDTYQKRVSAYYTRMVDGVPYHADGINVEYDTESKKIVSFSVDFSLIKNKTDASKIQYDLSGAYDQLFEHAGVTELYVVDEKNTPQLVYTLEQAAYATIDAVTGKAVGWNGREVEKPITSYTDIDGHWAQKYITRLAEIGYTTGSNEFHPDDKITQKDFLRLITRGEVDDEEMYKDLVAQKVLAQEEKNPDGFVTKQQAITYLLNWQGYREVANLKGIYVTGFDDEADIDGIGYVALAKGMGIVTGDTDHKFYPAKELTKAEAAAILYKSLDK